ncbi:hypothetical protein DF947_02785 [Pedobacter paludis]|uniref:Uncharacterized protein n=1 Tax=Pedobacter paludis TaxID=2203212 RepID=A0A317F372_9SPHI|nr:hypothetical protein DF947_02785 [Pedobacter paludis]
MFLFNGSSSKFSSLLLARALLLLPMYKYVIVITKSYINCLFWVKCFVVYELNRSTFIMPII